MSMNSAFENPFEGDALGTTEGVNVASEDNAAKDRKNAARSAEFKKMKVIFDEQVAANPAILEVQNSLTKHIVVANSLCYSDKGGLVNSSLSTKEKRQLDTVPQIVGYTVTNNSPTSISYMDFIWTKGEDGIYKEVQRTSTLEPGATAQFTRKMMTLFCSMPEIANRLANGDLIRSSRTKVTSLDDELEGFHFRPSDKSISVNSDEFKLQIANRVARVDEKGKPVLDEDGKPQNDWVVKDEYLEHFGYLMNPSNKKKSEKGSGGKKTDNLALVAAMIRQRVTEENSIG